MESIQNNQSKIEYELTDKFTDRRIDSGMLSESYKRLGFEDRAFRVLDCGTDLHFRAPVDHSEAPRLYLANFCKDRLCPMCGWRRSKKIFGQVSQVMDQVGDSYRFIFITLTVRNCSGDELPSVIDQMQKAWNLFAKYKRIKKAFRGYFKSLEITHHPEYPPSIQYHPHFHCIFVAPKRYFSKDCSDYIHQDELADLWAAAMKLSYFPMVDIRVVKPKLDPDGDVSIKGAVKEVAKYAIKSADLLYGTEEEIDERVYTFLRALSARRLCSFGGMLKKIAHDLKLDDMLDGDLVNTDNEKLRADVAYIIYNYRWVIGFGYQQHVVYREEKNIEVHK